MTIVQWFAVAGVVLFFGVLILLAWAYATGRLKSAPAESQSRIRWLPHSLRMRPLGHGIYKARDERRAEQEGRDGSGDSG